MVVLVSYYTSQLSTAFIHNFYWHNLADIGHCGNGVLLSSLVLKMSEVFTSQLKCWHNCGRIVCEL